MAERIEDYALIGDCRTAALVGKTGSIDWLCWPRFDSGACFAALLGGPENGRWLIAPSSPVLEVKREYLSGTLILKTELTTSSGRVVLTDFMPTAPQEASDLVRIVECLSGRVEMQTELMLRFDYGALVPWVTRDEQGSMHAIAGPDRVVLTTDVALRGQGLKTVGHFMLEAGESATFVLTHSPSHSPPVRAADPRQAMYQTEAFWRGWTARGTYRGEWSDAVSRSLLTLKALTFAPTAGIVAAATTSLPEHIGGERNWDYRFCWLRDATLTLLALMDAGHHEEAAGWRDWLLRATAGCPADLRVVYGLSGERRLPELTIDWLPGYEGWRVRSIIGDHCEPKCTETFAQMASTVS